MLPKVLDTILNGNVLFTRLMGGAKKWSGEKMKKTIKVSKNSTGGFFSGYDLLDTNATDNRVQLEFEPRFYYKTVSVPVTELSINAASETKVIDLMAAEMESAAHDMADDLGTYLYSGVGTTNTFNGLANIVDDGGTAATYGGQTRSTYTTLNATDTDSSGTLTLAKMATLYNAITSGSQKPTIGVTTETVFSLYEQLLNPQERITKNVDMYKGGLKGASGFTGLSFKGMDIVADEKATSGYLFFLNEDYLDFYALPVYGEEPFKYKTVTEGNDYGQVMGLGFTWDGWKKPVNQKAFVTQITLGGNFISWNPKRHGRLTGITGV
jgi:hypothetical protein